MRIELKRITISLLAVAVGACAHTPSAPSRPQPPAAITVSLAENGHPPSDGIIGVTNVCVNAAGEVQSVRVVQAMPARPQLADSIRGRRVPWGGGRPCFDVYTYCDDCNVPAPGAAALPATASTSPSADAGAPPATTSFRNVAPRTFDLARVSSPVPLLPDDVKLRRVGERLVFAAKICAGADGRIATIAIGQGIPGADAAIMATIRQWRLRAQPDGQGVCTLSQLVYDISAPR